ncbi:cytochrome c [Achromobacter aloeverae]|uniref:Alcohol dehydrogenase n=1 Tax=Achromobacter aloeverae TaxID=1750518 RepID=A0A4Q1HPK8_9BURK|nr:cytochrome c [Achromobacter aloeverae]RXN92296.1 alcohol dehydrogenase [Achromobacter aloeverae]
MNDRRQGIPRRHVVAACIAAILLGAVALWPDSKDTPERITGGVGESAQHAIPAASSIEDLARRGEYLAKAADCIGCHTARGGGQPYAGGFKMTTPLGIIISTNITPDPDHGIGRYTYEDFSRALRDGIARDGHNLYPAMPYTAFRRMREEDMRALYAYFMQGVEPVATTPAPTKLPFPFNQRWTLTLWRAVFAPVTAFRPPEQADPAMLRGAYLVQVVGHCGACHTPRGVGYQELAYDERSADFLTGQVNDDWYAPSLRDTDAAGIRRMRREDIVSFLKTGHAGGNVAYGAMSETIQSSTQHLTDEDLLAIATYLKALPPAEDNAHFHPDQRHRTERLAAEGNRTLDVQSGGAAVYQGFCARCHGADGAGVPGVFPALSGNPSVLVPDSTSLVRIVLQGATSPKTMTGPPPQEMPAFGTTLTDLQIAQVLTYVRESWGNDAGEISTNDVMGLRSTLGKR